MSAQVWVDPAEGWRFGFPKLCPRDVFNDAAKFTEWLLANGLPESHLSYPLRHWEVA